jgi:hypothetical protein
LNILSIAFFNFFGVSISKSVNAATRMVFDSMVRARTHARTRS